MFKCVKKQNVFECLINRENVILREAISFIAANVLGIIYVSLFLLIYSPVR